jgi:hypothetical protein
LKEVSWQESISHSSLLRLVASSLCLLSCYHCFIILRQTVVYLVYLALCIDPGKLRHDAAHKERDRANCQNSICSCSVCRTQWAVSSIVVLWLGHICKPSDCFYEHSGYSMPGEANVKPRQGHIIRSWLVWALRVCVYIYIYIEKGGGIVCIITPLFRNNICSKSTEPSKTQRNIGLLCAVIKVMRFFL